MAELYGNRWRNKGSLGGGGQGDVFRVLDETGEYQVELALKRLRDRSRIDRVKAEVEALRRLQHPNIVRVLDFSLPADSPGNQLPAYLVMPIATEGDLTKRLQLYNGSIEATVRVIRQLAEALCVAHANQVVHRDVKPANVLFPDKGHEAWLADFGICHIADYPRETRDGEIVGPRSFTAPELEAGGQTDVTPAVDVYSLGKLAFYMFTGGKLVPREDIHLPEYSRLLGVGERNNLLRSLLSGMIAPLSYRISRMEEVVTTLTKIEQWHEQARLLPLSPKALAAIDSVQSSARNVQRINSDNTKAREAELAAHQTLVASLLPWVGAELEKVAAHLRVPGVLESAVNVATKIQDMGIRLQIGEGGKMLMGEDGVELTFERIHDMFPVKSVLQFWLCKIGHFVTIQVGDGVQSQPFKDREMILLSRVVNLRPPEYRTPTSMGFPTSAEGREAVRSQLQARHGRPSAAQFLAPISMRYLEGVTLVHKFKTSEWPKAAESVRGMIAASLEAFIEHQGDPNRNISA